MSKVFTLKIEMDNDAFEEDNYTDELARILQSVIDTIENQGTMMENSTHNLYDYNGNRVGGYKVHVIGEHQKIVTEIKNR